MRLLEGLKDARMRKRVSQMNEAQMVGWMDQEINSLTQSWKVFTQTRSPEALKEVEGHLRAKAALVAGLRERLSGKFRL
jgi:hypothetical protein